MSVMVQHRHDFPPKYFPFVVGLIYGCGTQGYRMPTVFS